MPKTPTTAEMNAIFEKVKNWGRWGADDERGALNLITAAKRVEAAAAVKHGHAVSCARELPVIPSIENPHPALHMMTMAGDDCVIPGFDLQSSGDFVGVAFHGMATSHIDALCHVFVERKMYNGYSADEVKSTGARKNSIMAAKDGIVSRGVLLDIPRLRESAWLEPNDQVSLEDLHGAEAAQKCAVSEGDILLVATGRDARRAEKGPWSPVSEGLAGLHAECVPWLHERGIAVLGCDGISDPLPGDGIPGWAMPVHQCALAGMGVHLLDNLRLDGLMAACAQREQWTFQVTIAPLRVAGGTGSPVNPIALL